MGISLEWDRKGETCVLKAAGKLDFSDFKRAIDDFFARGTGRDTLWDLTQVDVSDIKASDLEELSRMRSLFFKIRKQGKTAVVASANLAYGMARMVQGMLPEEDDSPYRVFRDLDSARAWLEER